VSARGIGLEFPGGSGPAGVDERIEGVLRGAGAGSFEVLIECTNVRPHPEDERLWIVGGRLTIADDDASRRYKAFVASLLA
jgi:hypothetical protein